MAGVFDRFCTMLQKIFAVRGYSEDYIKSMCDGSHGELLDTQKFCDLLHEARMTNSKVVFLPDFDMDGIMSGVIGFAGLAELGFNVTLFIPDPDDGYGFTPTSIARLVTENPDVKYIVTADVGITCFDGIRMAKQSNITVLVTDHHPPENKLPEADVIVDPMRKDDPYANPEICGAHVIFQLLCSYTKKYGTLQQWEQIRRLSVFAGIGTVSDSMPLVCENRKIVRDAIGICQMVYSGGNDTLVRSLSGTVYYCRAFWGLYRCLCAFAEEGIIKTDEDIDEDFFGYYLAPTFNSVKRIGDDMRRAFGVFFEGDTDGHIKFLRELNTERKRIVEECLANIDSRDQPYAPFVYLADGPAGVMGLLAQKKMDASGVPTLVVAPKDGKLKGSGRSPDWYPFRDRTAHRHDIDIGGHNGAFGASFIDETAVKSFMDFLSRDMKQVLGNRSAGSSGPELVISLTGNGDIDLDISEFDRYLSEIAIFKPLGRGFPEPEMLLQFPATAAEFRVIGHEKSHLRMDLPHGFAVLCWSQAYKLDACKNADVIEVRGTLSESEFRGRRTVQFEGVIL